MMRLTACLADLEPLCPMPLRFTNLAKQDLPIDLAGVTPNGVARQSLAEVQRTLVRQGNRQLELGELLRVEGDPADLHWRLEGDFSRVHGIAVGMVEGHVVVDGPVGRHAGAQMRAGRLEVRGHAGDWLGAEMQGGLIRVHGNVDDHAGGAYLGSRRGMNGGTLLVDGNAGRRVGERLRRGLIAVAGAADAWLGKRMLAGTILLFGRCGEHPGAGLRRGALGLFGAERPTIPPTFRPGYAGPLPMLPLLERRLHDLGFQPPRLRALAGRVELFHGDLLELGRGEILLPA